MITNLIIYLRNICFYVVFHNCNVFTFGYGTITVQADVCSIVPSVDHACYRHTLYTIYVLPRVGNHYFLIR